MKTGKNWVEWTVFGVSLIIILAALALLVIDARRGDGQGPRVRIEAGLAVPQPPFFRVPVRVYNDGHQSAEEVRIEVTLRSGSREIERGDFTLSFLPRRSHREGSVLFKNDPRGLDIEARPVGFVQP
jgi:uncharacterized protein (TIGR02588 family)